MDRWSTAAAEAKQSPATAGAIRTKAKAPAETDEGGLRMPRYYLAVHT
jgi:hypothetical protein